MDRLRLIRTATSLSHTQLTKGHRTTRGLLSNWIKGASKRARPWEPQPHQVTRLTPSRDENRIRHDKPILASEPSPWFSTTAHGTDSAQDQVRFMSQASEYLPAMLQAINAAKEEVLMEMYWFDSDNLGWQVARALIRAASRGVSVRVVHDSFGCMGVNQSMFAAMEAAGCEVLEFNPIVPWRNRLRLDRLNRRDHRKILVVDRGVAFTGGVNICDHWAPAAWGGSGWKDYMVCVRGSAAPLFAQVIERLLPDLRASLDDRGKAAGIEPWVRKRRTELQESMMETKEDLLSREWTVDTAWFSVLHQARSADVQVVTNDAWNDPVSIRRGYLRAIRSARSRILIVNSYFLPDRRIRRALYRARERGVKVTILVPGNSDVWAIQYATRAMYDRFVRRGIEIREWNPTVLHAKLAVVDGVCTIGTYNLDHRSWHFNLEVIGVIHNPAFCDHVIQRIEEDCVGNCTSIQLGQWRSRGYFVRALESWCHLFRRWL